MELTYIGHKQATARVIHTFEGYGYRVTIEAWNDGRTEINTTPIMDVLHSPDLDVVEGEGALSLDLNYMPIEKVQQVIDGLNRAVQLYEAIKGIDVDGLYR